MREKIKRGLALAMFSILIISFVAYRSGFFGMNSKHPLRTLNNQTDSIPNNDSVKIMEMMPSSKVLILKDQQFQRTDSSLKLDPLIYSSKSGIILKPEDFRETKQDSIIIDSLNKE